MQTFAWSVIKAMKARGYKITPAYLYEQSQCKDSSKFVMVLDHPIGSRVFRIWPKEQQPT